MWCGAIVCVFHFLWSLGSLMQPTLCLPLQARVVVLSDLRLMLVRTAAARMYSVRELGRIVCPGCISVLCVCGRLVGNEVA